MSDDIVSTQQLVANLALAAELVTARNDQATRRMETSAEALGQTAQQLTGGGERFAKEALDTIRAKSGQALSQGMEPTFQTFQQKIQGSMGLMEQLDLALARHRQGVQGLIRNGLIALVLGGLAIMGAASYVAYDRYQVIESAQFGQDILHATNNGTITRCGDKLCVRIGKTPARYKQNPEYTLLSDNRNP